MNVWDRYRDNRIVYQAGLRAAKYDAPGSFTIEEWRDLCAKHDNRCVHCRELKPLTADHIIPMSRGGTNYISNIQPLCKSCNSRKRDKIPDDVKAVHMSLSLSELLSKYRSFPRHRLIIDWEQARKLGILTDQSDIGIDQFVEELIEQTWQQAIEREQAS